jgi:hypothetical protein
MSDEAPNVWIPDELLEYYRERADGDENITDVNHAIRIVLRKHVLFEQGQMQDPLEELKLATITCCKCE